jgi:hypothetical protein
VIDKDSKPGHQARCLLPQLLPRATTYFPLTRCAQVFNRIVKMKDGRDK